MSTVVHLSTLPPSSRIIRADAVPLFDALKGRRMTRFDVRQKQSGPPIPTLDKVRRALGAAAHGAEVGSLAGLTVSTIARKVRPGLKISADGSAAGGAVVGAALAGALRYRRDSRNFDARTPALQRLNDAVARNVSVSVPGADEAQTAAEYARKQWVRRVVARGLKIGAGVGVGAYLGRKAGTRTGAIAGGVAGALL